MEYSPSSSGAIQIALSSLFSDTISPYAQDQLYSRLSFFIILDSSSSLALHVRVTILPDGAGFGFAMIELITGS
jgi:hypothetical protein